MTTRLVAALGLTLLAASCGKDSTDSKGTPAGREPSKTVAAAAGQPTDPTATTPPTTPEPPKPATAEYSPEVAAKLLADLEKCEYDFNCEAYKPLVGFGAKVAPDLAKLAADAAKDKKARQVAIKALAEIKDPTTGVALLEAGLKEQDFMVRGDLFEAAGATGSEEVFTKVTGLFLAGSKDVEGRDLEKAIEQFGKKGLDWAVAEYAKAKDQVGLANIVIELAAAADLPVLQDLLGKSKDVMAGHRLASKAVELGDVAGIAVLVKGLESKDQYDRSDAANFLAKVADKVPADQRDKVIELLKKGMEKDQGGLTAMGFEACLKKLGAQ